MQSNPDISVVIWKSQKAIESKHLQKLIEKCNIGFCGQLWRLYESNLRKLNYLVIVMEPVQSYEVSLCKFSNFCWFKKEFFLSGHSSFAHSQKYPTLIEYTMLRELDFK